MESALMFLFSFLFTGVFAFCLALISELQKRNKHLEDINQFLRKENETLTREVFRLNNKEGN